MTANRLSRRGAIAALVCTTFFSLSCAVSIQRPLSALRPDLGIRKQVELRKSLADDAGDTEMVEAAEVLLAALKQWQESVTTPHRGNNQDVLNFAPQLDASGCSER